jgi:hypothetical protein
MHKLEILILASLSLSDTLADTPCQ